MLVKSKEYDSPNLLMQTTIKLVKQKGIEDTAFETLIPFGWLQKFCAGTFKNPSVNRVVFLYEHLSGTKLIGK